MPSSGRWSLWVAALFLVWPAGMARASRCRSGWHRVGGRCVRDTCPAGWQRGRDRACHPRSCPRGFSVKGRLCVPKRCPKGQVRDAKGRCGLIRKMAPCGPGRFRNAFGLCRWLPKIRGYGISRSARKHRRLAAARKRAGRGGRWAGAAARRRTRLRDGRRAGAHEPVVARRRTGRLSLRKARGKRRAGRRVKRRSAALIADRGR